MRRRDTKGSTDVRVFLSPYCFVEFVTIEAPLHFMSILLAPRSSPTFKLCLRQGWAYR